MPWLACVAAVIGAGAAGCGDDDGAPPDAAMPARDAAVIERDGGAPIVGTTYYVELSGDDTADGSEGAPWATIPRGLGALEPGDTLLIGDGDWPRFRIDCAEGITSCDGQPCEHGLPNGRITVRARHERRARIQSADGETTLELHNCDWWTVEGLVVELGDFPDQATNYTPIFRVGDSEHLIVRRNVVQRSNRWANSHGLWTVGANHILIEENEIYEFHRHGITVHAAFRPIVRRNYVNSRDTPNETDPMAFSCCCETGGDEGITIEGTFGGIVENNIVEDTCAGIAVRGDANSLTDSAQLSSKSNRMIGNIGLSLDGSAFGALSYCDGASPCDPADITEDTEIRDAVSVDCTRAVNTDGARNTVIREVTSIRASSVDFRLWRGDSNAAVTDPSFIVMNALDVGDGTGIGYLIQDHPDWQVVGSNSFGNETDFSADSENAVMHGNVDPGLGPCYVYIPDGSPMRGAGISGRDIGANVIYRTVDGRLTDEPLWDPATGAFPCGAVVPGVNDVATLGDDACSTVHERLNIGTNGCPAPPLR